MRVRGSGGGIRSYPEPMGYPLWGLGQGREPSPFLPNKDLAEFALEVQRMEVSSSGRRDVPWELS